ncbi:hypothetical protein METBIDRAFT_38502 [Metschnikowia bicuspidata var. bicuspidata NRRL YB-4993]|uniref:Genetic interactor of prohibitin 7, mitochondrial n=1 Tax=Metschnikowia bicuspidata var. bicuspidata NRRL YB-4993 TaxID=869754 RepID=A0A1A0HG55_9ASCO|nr:hypothetical protein METBIDRAFT_38502 [Metschnikowia bicuspidata var. bicuspidata NRRL YB-4993]OBA22838.1 hypothetical protein METBIDRAFT_38502 [Metschnikowia bicuspidata var. bicuspidata NRRL YB-4993]
MYKLHPHSVLRGTGGYNSRHLQQALKKNRSFFTTQNILQKPQDAVPQVNGKKLTPQEAKLEAAKLAMSSLKEVGSLFSSGNDDAVQPIDSSPVFENPYVFGTLNVVHQGQVAKELQEKFDGKWSKLTDKDKRLGYYIAYGNWGVRENFHQWNSPDAPWDLPFTVPSKIRTASPSPGDKIHKLEPVYLAETEVRKSQFDTKKTDPVTKTFIYITAFVIVFALARDKKVGEEGKPVEYISVDQYAKQREDEKRELQLKQDAEKEAALAKARARKWYYLWLK